jgi:hypothetical protein
MYYWRNRDIELYNIIMMNTEKNISGKNWNIYLITLYHLPEFSGKLALGDNAYKGDKLKIINTDCEIEGHNDKYVVSQNGLQTEYPIQQIDGIDAEDRIGKGKQIIIELINASNE